MKAIIKEIEDRIIYLKQSEIPEQYEVCYTSWALGYEYKQYDEIEYLEKLLIKLKEL